MEIAVQALGFLFGWLQRRRLVSEAFAQSFYLWADSLGERQRIPAQLRASLIAQRERLLSPPKPEAPK
jgi:hypothetical protein